MVRWGSVAALIIGCSRSAAEDLAEADAGNPPLFIETAHPGTRLRFRVARDDEGFRAIIAVHDSLLGADCSAAVAADGRIRCVPIADRFSGWAYADATCTIEAMLLARDEVSRLVVWTRGAVGASSRKASSAQRGARVPVAYEATDAGCVPAPALNAYVFSPIAAAEMVELTPDSTGGDRFATPIFRSTDGLLVPLANTYLDHERRLAIHCPGHMENCAPVVAFRGGIFGDAACGVPAAFGSVLDEHFYPLADMDSRPVVRVLDRTLAFVARDGRCDSDSVMAWTTGDEVIDLVTDGQWDWEGRRRLRARHRRGIPPSMPFAPWESIDRRGGPPFGLLPAYSATPLRDTLHGFDCNVTVFPDGLLRCAPARTAFVGYSDPRCSQRVVADAPGMEAWLTLRDEDRARTVDVVTVDLPRAIERVYRRSGDKCVLWYDGTRLRVRDVSSRLADVTVLRDVIE
jgi:hypothetical protein